MLGITRVSGDARVPHAADDDDDSPVLAMHLRPAYSFGTVWSADFDPQDLAAHAPCWLRAATVDDDGAYSWTDAPPARTDGVVFTGRVAAPGDWLLAEAGARAYADEGYLRGLQRWHTADGGSEARRLAPRERFQVDDAFGMVSAKSYARLFQDYMSVRFPNLERSFELRTRAAVGPRAAMAASRVLFECALFPLGRALHCRPGVWTPARVDAVAVGSDGAMTRERWTSIVQSELQQTLREALGDPPSPTFAAEMALRIVRDTRAADLADAMASVRAGTAACWPSRASLQAQASMRRVCQLVDAVPCA